MHTAEKVIGEEREQGRVLRSCQNWSDSSEGAAQNVANFRAIGIVNVFDVPDWFTVPAIELTV